MILTVAISGKNCFLSAWCLLSIAGKVKFVCLHNVKAPFLALDRTDNISIILCSDQYCAIKLFPSLLYYPARACASKGLCDRSWRLYIVCILYIVYKSALFFGTNLISPKILTFRGLF